MAEAEASLKKGFKKRSRQFPVINSKGDKDFKDRNKQSQAREKITSTMAIEMVKVHLFIVFLIQLMKTIAIYVGRLRI